MGLTAPFLTAFIDRRFGSLGHSAGLLYWANTIGAGLGALTTGYVLLPTVGISTSLWIAVLLNIGVAFVALRLKDQRPHNEAAHQTEAHHTDRDTDASIGIETQRLGVLAVVILTIGGFVTFALENTYIHLLAVVVGNSAYAFSAMLFTFLIGLGGGAAMGRFVLTRFQALGSLLCVSQGGLAITVLSGIFLWNHIPEYFGSFAGYPLTTSFGAREFVRLAVCSATMIPVAACIGFTYPMQWNAWAALGLIDQSFGWDAPAHSTRWVIFSELSLPDLYCCQS